ncbi:uncharacterized protein LOC117177311 [Belonocnema kinseyi]|uniref:uncharacterized protein LOC117177311 n=1 Tax=Belonocnema kinseyi TaxID=2817044 RepID=UPI00143D09FD|nr:uncharacterized protein LOC117177311 [Belonocnema kinseyi]
MDASDKVPRSSMEKIVRSISRLAWNSEQESIQITPLVAVPSTATRNWSSFNAKKMTNDMMTYFFDRDTMEKSSVTGEACSLHVRKGIPALSKLGWRKSERNNLLCKRPLSSAGEPKEDYFGSYQGKIE